MPLPGGPTIWQRLHAVARRWPWAYRAAHHASLWALPALLLSGVALYLPAWRTPLIPYLEWIYWGHIVLGLGYAVLLLLPLAFPVTARRLAGFDWLVVLVTGGGLTITGVLLWLVNWIPATLTFDSFEWHGLLAILVGAWAVWHGYVRLRRVWRPSARGSAAPARPSARGGTVPARPSVQEGTAPARPGALSIPSSAPARPRAAATASPTRPASTPNRQLLARRDFLRWALTGTGVAVAAVLFGHPILRAWQALGRHPEPNTTVPGTPAGPNPESALGPPSPGWPGFQLYTVTGGYPVIPPDKWTLQVDGMVTDPQTFTFADFLALPQTTETRTFHCVTGWVVPNVEWQGVRVADILAKVRPTGKAAYITLHSGDGEYTESLSLEQASASDVLLVHSMNGRPLPRAQGAPVRLFIPEMYGYKSIKWVTRIYVTDGAIQGYWEGWGYPNDAYIRQRG